MQLDNATIYCITLSERKQLLSYPPYSIYLDFRLKINCVAANIDANLLANKTKRDPFS